MIEWVLVIGSGRMWAPGSELPAWWGYLCSGSLEEGMEEQIAKAEGWSSQGASHAHPDGGPDAETNIRSSQVGRGLGPQPISSCWVSIPASVGLCPSPAKCPESTVTRSLLQVLPSPSPPVSSSPLVPCSPACYPLLPGVSQPPFPGGVKPMGEG